MPASHLSDKENRTRMSRKMPSQTQTQTQVNKDDELAMVTGDTGLAYDPDQDKDEKRQIRREYRKEIETAETDRNAVNNVSIDELNERVAKGNKLFQNVKNPSEAVLDSKLLLITSDIGAAKARAMKHDANAFDTDDYIQKLITLMGGRKADQDDDDPEEGPLEWEVAGWRAVKRTRRVIGMDFMLGPLSIEQKKRVITKRAKLDKNKEDETRPQELTEKDIERSENETTKNVKAVYDVLEKYVDEHEIESVNIFRLVVNPESFAQTVENIFYLSFSIRDGKVALDQNSNGEFVVYPCQPPTDDDYKDGLKKRQVVLEMDMATWKDAIELLNLTEPLIPTRAEARTRLGDKWYG